MAGDDKVHHVASLAELNQLLASTTYVAVDFYADWCPPCKSIAPHYAALAARHARPGALAFAKVNVDGGARDAAAAHRVTAMPTFLFFKEGRQVAVNGAAAIRGADPRALAAAADKLAGLAEKRLQQQQQQQQQQ
ncbi:thioredoxin domain-containing protein [Xylariaceae sp. FL0804]|nr:thioredoxin domain-containing protein [Xylariaceae sp. FL0804]